MSFQKKLEALKKSDKFKNWKNKHSSSFLAHAFLMLDDANKNIWQFGYYNPNKERMTTFIVESEQIRTVPDQEVLKSEGSIKPLHAEEVEVSCEKALQEANECFNEHYKNQQHIKHFFIIQTYEDNPIYNITYLSQNLSTINIKINAKTGRIIKHSQQQLATFG